MREFELEQSLSSALEATAAAAKDGASFIAGGTTMVDLMKLGVVEPERLVDLLELRGALSGITVDDEGVHIGALSTMAEVARHPEVRRGWSAVTEALLKAASAQIRNAATIGGNLLQRTRCPYFRDVRWACNKRDPGQGCSAVGGDTRGLAILGTSEHCVANYAGDLAVALVALGARVHTVRPDGEERTFELEELHRLPGARPDLEPHPVPRALILGVTIPARPWANPVSGKVRARPAYPLAPVSAAAAPEVEAGARPARAGRPAPGGCGPGRRR